MFGNGKDIETSGTPVVVANNIFGATTFKPGNIFEGSEIYSHGHNIARTGDAVSILTDPTDQNSTNPMLDILADHGGPTLSWSIQATGPGIDDVGADTLTTDGRRFTRDALVDVGAFEYGASGPAIPIVLSRSNDTILCEGDSLMLFITATGGAPLGFQWQLNGVDILTATDSTYWINPANPLVAGEYRCLVNNGGGADTSGVINIQIGSRSAAIGSFSPDTVCNGGGLVPLPSGIPSGGSYSGAGVSGLNFDPMSAGVGSHYIFYTFIDTLGCEGTDSTLVHVEICTDLENESIQELIIYRDQNTGMAGIQFTNLFAGNYAFQVYDMTGKLVKNVFEGPLGRGSQTLSLSYHDLTDGIYIFKINTPSGPMEKKVALF